MAYLDLIEAEAAGAIGSPIYSDTPRHDPAVAERFSAMEWLVIALGEREGLASLREPSRLSRALARLFGHDRGDRRLANPQLEALRRMAALAGVNGYRQAPSELAAFRRAGYSSGQLELLINSVVRGRARNAGQAGTL